MPSRCYRCHQLTPDFAVCTNCQRQSRLKHVWVCTEYSGLAKQLVHDFKFAHARAAALPLARSLDELLPYFSPETIVVSVPTATSRQRQRGYDHARLLARELAKLRHFDYMQPLARLSHTRQVGASRKQRFEQLKDAFIVTKPALIKDRQIVLVDDIVTTGATLEAVAGLLKAAGAKCVDAIVFAQKR
jgi:ComF family protein